MPQVADAEADAAERRQEAEGQQMEVELPLEAEHTLGNGDAAGDAATDVPSDAFAAVREALAQSPKPAQKSSANPGAS